MDLKSNSAIEIINAISEAESWFQAYWDSNKSRSSLRTLEFAPDIFQKNHFYTVKYVICARKYKINENNIETNQDISISKGKVLIYDPDSNMSDGMSEGETDGFIDVNDCPPWDIWIGYIAVNRNRYVLSWIPNQLIGLVEEAIFVNCSGSLYWLEDCNEIWANELRLLLSKH